jgi:hypothetical protein
VLVSSRLVMQMGVDVHATTRRPTNGNGRSTSGGGSFPMNKIEARERESSEFHLIFNEWLGVEHYRIHVMELWPDGPRKEAGLAAARSALGSLVRAMPTESSFACTTCVGRAPLGAVIPRLPWVHRLPSGLAA